MTIGERIKARRLDLGYSQEELAQKLGYKSRSTINKIELGINDITKSKIQALAKALQTTPSFLMEFTDDPYDYRLDPEHRLDEIPPADRETLEKAYHNDPELMWRAWRQVQEAVQKAVRGLTLQEPAAFPEAERRLSAEDERLLETLQGNKRLRDFIQWILALPQDRQTLVLTACLALAQSLAQQLHDE